MPRSRAEHHAGDGDRRADRHRHVHPRDELGGVDDPQRADRSHRADPAAPQRGIRTARRGGGDRSADAERNDRHPLRAGERELRREHAAADGRRLGQPVTRVV